MEYVIAIALSSISALISALIALMLRKMEESNKKYRQVREQKEREEAARKAEDTRRREQLLSALAETQLLYQYHKVMDEGVYRLEDRPSYNILFANYEAMGYNGRMGQYWSIVLGMPDEHGKTHSIPHELENIL
jgi:hypothetical protein